MITETQLLSVMVTARDTTTSLWVWIKHQPVIDIYQSILSCSRKFRAMPGKWSESMSVSTAKVNLTQTGWINCTAVIIQLHNWDGYISVPCTNVSYCFLQTHFPNE